MFVVFVLHDIDPLSEDTLHRSKSEVAIGNAIAVSSLFAFLIAMMPFIESLVQYLHLMLIFHLFTHLIHELATLPVKDQT